jgi:hypothetical protein
VAPAGKYSVWSAEGVPRMFGAGGQWAAAWLGRGPASGWQHGGQVAVW